MRIVFVIIFSLVFFGCSSLATTEDPTQGRGHTVNPEDDNSPKTPQNDMSDPNHFPTPSSRRMRARLEVITRLV